ncbi:MAG: type II toxin-antitoxin system YafQ family toxin [Firmicutes bacterium]|nr:type II toxin-antitoxin system YafQ family toxin [Bacillota bacterium]MBQ9604177.1 type II toxin-antitoxin system YafQ family toxin [Bacillota bacterium]
MNFKVIWTSRFKKDYKLAEKRGLDMELIDNVIRMLARGEVLPQVFDDHSLSSNWNGYRECHIRPDWLLIYKIDEDNLVLALTRTGTHSDLFGK